MEKLNISGRICRAGVLLVTLGITAGVIAQDKIDQVVNTGVSRNDDAQKSQARIDQTASEADRLVAAYRRELKVIDGLKIYNRLMQRQLDDQQSDMQKLRNSIDEVAVIERQITPTMVNMLEALEAFIERDVPFLLDERNNRVARLRAAVESADITTAEKFRAVLEAFSIEGNYGRTIEAYTGTLNIDGINREVDFMKVGRIALMYQTADREINGVWDQSNRAWVKLEDSAYKNHLAKGLQIARGQVAPDILMVPIVASEVK